MLFGALMLAFAIVPTALADSHQQDSGNLPTSAIVGAGGGGIAPTIICKWELPDMDRNAANGVQYNNDDDDLAFPATPPCDLLDGVAAYVPGAVAIQVLANAHDEPTERAIELWAAVGHELGIFAVSDVYWKIYHPDGTFKVQVHGTPIDVCPAEALGAYAGNATLLPGSMFEAAYETGQLSNAAITDANGGLMALCNEYQLRFWVAQFDLSKHQPCGLYQVEVYATSSGATTAATINYIEVYCFIQMELDFADIQFGNVVPGIPKIVAGNLLFDDGKPSVANTGSGGLNVGVKFLTMYQDSVSDGSEKWIDKFDAMFGIDSNHLEVINPIFAADTPDPLLAGQLPPGGIYWFSPADTQTVCANEVFKLDFSIHPGAGLPADSYSGAAVIYAMADIGTDDNVPTFKNPDGYMMPYTCNNDNGLWGGFQLPGGLSVDPYGANQRTSSGLLGP